VFVVGTPLVVLLTNTFWVKEKRVPIVRKIIPAQPQLQRQPQHHQPQPPPPQQPPPQQPPPQQQQQPHPPQPPHQPHRIRVMIAVHSRVITIHTMTVLGMIGKTIQARELVMDVRVTVKMVQMCIRNQRDQGRLQQMGFVRRYLIFRRPKDAEANHWDGSF